MLFSSIEFIFRFLPIFLLLYYLMPSGGRNLILLIGSLFFYAVGEPVYVLLMAGSILLNYGAARWIAAVRPVTGKRILLFLTAAVDLGVLFTFKYWGFFAENVNLLLHRDLIPMLALTLPLGISFYTFQMISYVTDVCRGTAKDPGTFLEFACYVSMFPQLIAGPIVQFPEVSQELKHRRLSKDELEQGLEFFCLGLGAKVLLANKIAIFWNQVQGIGFSSISTPVAWMGAWAFSFQIYFDFWGYSLMAMGLGKMLGFRIPQNFDVPYMSKSVTDFWRRWHITLGRFFREYVYIPLGGNRRGVLRTVVNMLIVWTLTGLWHGASWNFVLWGLGFFVLLVCEKYIYGKWLHRFGLLGHIYMWLIIPVSWMVFEIGDFTQLLIYLKRLTGIYTGEVLVSSEQLLRYVMEYGWLFLLCALCATYFPRNMYYSRKGRFFRVVVCYAVFWWSVYELHQGASNPFLYFRF